MLILSYKATCSLSCWLLLINLFMVYLLISLYYTNFDMLLHLNFIIYTYVIEDPTLKNIIQFGQVHWLFILFDLFFCNSGEDYYFFVPTQPICGLLFSIKPKYIITSFNIFIINYFWEGSGKNRNFKLSRIYYNIIIMIIYINILKCDAFYKVEFIINKFL